MRLHVPREPLLMTLNGCCHLTLLLLFSAFVFSPHTFPRCRYPPTPAPHHKVLDDGDWSYSHIPAPSPVLAPASLELREHLVVLNCLCSKKGLASESS